MKKYLIILLIIAFSQLSVCSRSKNSEGDWGDEVTKISSDTFTRASEGNVVITKGSGRWVEGVDRSAATRNYENRSKASAENEKSLSREIILLKQMVVELNEEYSPLSKYASYILTFIATLLGVVLGFYLNKRLDRKTLKNNQIVKFEELYNERCCIIREKFSLNKYLDLVFEIDRMKTLLVDYSKYFNKREQRWINDYVYSKEPQDIVDEFQLESQSKLITEASSVYMSYFMAFDEKLRWSIAKHTGFSEIDD